MKIGDKAERADQDEIRLARDSAGLYRLEDDELTAADELSAEDEFPKYGDFISCKTTTGGAEPSWNEPVYVECPGSLAKIIVEMEISVGDSFRIQSTRKNAAGEWEYSVVEETPDF